MGGVETQGKALSEIKENQEMTSEIRANKTQINVRKTPEELEGQNLIDKESDLRKQFLHLQEEMRVKINQNANLNRQIAVVENQHQMEVQRLKAEIRKLQEQKISESPVEVMLVSGDDRSEKQSSSESKQIAQLQSRIIALQSDLEKATFHSRNQSHDILSLKQELQGTKVS